LQDLAVQKSSMPEPDSITDMVLNATTREDADRAAVSSLLAAWRGGLCAEAVADGLLVAVNEFSTQVPHVETLRWVVTVLTEYLTPDLATDVFAAFAGNECFDVEVIQGKRRISGGSQQYTGNVEISCPYADYHKQLISHLDEAWTQLPPGGRVPVLERAEGYGSPYGIYWGHGVLRQAYMAHLTRCADEAADVARALRIGLTVHPPRFPGDGCAAKSLNGRKRRKLVSSSRCSSYSSSHRRHTRRVHGLYLGPILNPDQQHTDLSSQLRMIWGPEQMQKLVGGPLRKVLVQNLLACPACVIAYTLTQEFLSKLEADEQIALLGSLGKQPSLLQAWATPENLGCLTLPAKRHAVGLLLPAVATLKNDVRQIVLNLSLG